VLRIDRMLEQRTTECKSGHQLEAKEVFILMRRLEILWTSWNHLHLMRHQRHHRCLDGRSKQLGQPSHCSFCSRFRCRSQIEHHSGLRCRVCAQEHPWRAHDDVAGTYLTASLVGPTSWDRVLPVPPKPVSVHLSCEKAPKI
jgi:hypothetical protein